VCSSVGRARSLYLRGPRFESWRTHQYQTFRFLSDEICRASHGDLHKRGSFIWRRVREFLSLQEQYTFRIVLATLRAIYSRFSNPSRKLHWSFLLSLFTSFISESEGISLLTGAVHLSYRTRYAPCDILKVFESLTKAPLELSTLLIHFVHFGE
jgi:hypothetical protein